MKTSAKTFVDLQGLGMTETLGFTCNITLTERRQGIIEVTDVERNNKNKRVSFVSVSNPEVLASLIDSFSHEHIEQKFIDHNRFAVYNYQIFTK